MKKITVFLLSFVFGIVASASAASILIYSNDFDGNAVVSSGVTASDILVPGISDAESIQGLPSPFSGNLLRNTTAGNPASYTTLSLGNLPSHNSIDINFLLAFIDSWDGSSIGSFSPDFFNVNIDGITILQIASNNVGGGGSYLGGVQLGFAQYGWGTTYPERAVDMATESLLTLAHTAPTLTIDFFASGSGWQGGGDESWGMDNLSVLVNTTGAPSTVPEPGTMALVVAGLIGLLGVANKNRR